MSLPSQNLNGGPPRSQPSIRSFFQPAAPKYGAPPSAERSPQQQHSPPPPQVSQHTSSPRSSAPPQAPQSAPLPPPAAPPLPLRTAENGSGEPATAVPMPAPTPTHHPNITLSPILPSHIPSLKHLTARLLPVRYPDSFYVPLSDPLSSGAFSRVLLWTDTPTPSNPSPKPTLIGGLVCRPQTTFQPRPNSAQDLIPDALYVQSLVLQEPYRGLGLAARMLEEVCTLAARDERFACRTVCAHVWTENEEGWEWYKARGFAKVEPVIEGYYRQLQPSNAWAVRRDISLGSVSGRPGRTLDAVKANGIGTHAGLAKVSTPPVASFTSSTITTTPPPPSSGPPSGARSPNPSVTRPPPISGTSYQKKGPENEWNDLPEDMVLATRTPSNNLSVPGSGANSGASSRSSSTVGRKKRDRAYPAAAFGN
ncbi:hypothetical protein PFICI_09878 [Pestalotiopsis fici W106-1]|uniref:N-acetyltransferase domain-containing protein n=1 Tax=Pestalotiopsis fici (strain W106-1 / CGMCC3.15140) TaxID=1229662 RepID=W3WY54_PESFW|nr:uncharacterized protein PFICI_09878 [Pestalotiopsis fici W106-1]ETS77816.1 hypothetical protein PFICI_09878 [Pestalotiopsis fici W106-1]